MNEQETIYTMALTRMNYFNLAGLLQLYRELGSATAIIENREHLKEMVPEASPRLLSGLKDLGEAMKRAETEWEYDQQYGSRPESAKGDQHRGNKALHYLRTGCYTTVCAGIETTMSTCAHRERNGLWRGYPCTPRGAAEWV